jgi:hypothetical protein
MIRLTDEQWERIRMDFPEEHIADGRPGRKPILPANSSMSLLHISMASCVPGELIPRTSYGAIPELPHVAKVF